MDWQSIATGFAVAFSWQNVLYALIGCLAGSLIGVLPGIGPTAGIALLLPICYGAEPTSALIMLAGIYYGAMYGGSTTSVLLNVPGESASVVTCLDGYPLARQGRAGPALAVAAIGSFYAGTMGVLALTFLGPQIARLGLAFGPPEYFALMLFALVAVASFSGEGPKIKALISTVFGLMLSTVGQDLQTGVARFTFGNPELLDGIEFLVVAVGLFGISEVVESIVEADGGEIVQVGKLGRILPSLQDLRQSFGAMTRGGLIGLLVGVLPGTGATIPSFLAYEAERRLSRHPERFGKGAIEGVAAPESANNSAAMSHLAMLLTLGIPGGAATAVLLGGFIMFGLQPGPLLFRDHPDVVWAVVASMYLGNLVLLILNMPLVGMFARVVLIPKSILLPLVLGFCSVGVYCVGRSVQDLWLMTAFGIIGYVMRKYGFPLPPALLALVLGGLMEQALRQALTLSNGSPAILVVRPISAVFLALTAIVLLLPVLRRKRSAVAAG